MTRFEITFFIFINLLLANIDLNALLHDTYLVVAHLIILEKFPTLKITREGKSSTWSGPQRARPARPPEA